MERTGVRETIRAIGRIHERFDVLERWFGELPDRGLRGWLIDHLLQFRAECDREYAAREQDVAGDGATAFVGIARMGDCGGQAWFGRIRVSCCRVPDFGRLAVFAER